MQHSDDYVVYAMVSYIIAISIFYFDRQKEFNSFSLEHCSQIEYEIS